MLATAMAGAMGTLATIGFLAVTVALCAAGLWLAAAGGLVALTAGLLAAALTGGAAVGFALQLTPRAAPVPDAEGAILIRPNRARLMGYSATAALVAAACPQIAVEAARQGGMIDAGVAIAGAVVFAAAACLGFYRRLQPRALYRLDQVGIASFEDRGWFVPWRAIRGIDAISASGAFWLALDVDSTVTRPRRPPNLTANIPPFAVSAHEASIPFDQFAELVQRYWQRGKLLRTHN